MVQIQSIAQKLLSPLGIGVVRVESNRLATEATPAEKAIYDKAREFTMTSPERLWALMQAVSYVVRNDLQGDFVECGVWRGGSAMTIALQLQKLGVTDRDLWLYDTFQGMTPPTDADVDARTGTSARKLLSKTTKAAGNNVWCIASLDDVRANVQSTGYPMDRVHFKEGDVAVTLLEDRPSTISVLRLDTDWYESTKVELETLFPALVPGGVCIIDDYGHWEGARRAVDEYLAEHKLSPLLNRIDYTGRLFVKS